MVTTMSSSASRSSIVRSVVSAEDLGAALVAELLLERRELVLDDPEQALLGRQDALEVRDEGQRLLVLLDDLVALELGQALQPHVEDGLGLDLGELQLAHQGVLGRVRALRLADEADDEVELVDRLAQALQDVGPLFRARQIVLGPAGDDLAAERDELLEHLLEVDDLRAPAHEGQHDHPEGGLHLGVLVELVDHDLRHLAPAQLQHDADALAARLVAALADALDPLVAHELADLLHQRGLVHLVRAAR